MPDWATISSLATAGGTLVLAIATFGSTRSANRAARTAEKTLDLGLQPLLVTTRPEDPPESASFGEGVVFRTPGGAATVEERDGNYFIVLPVRNVGTGLAVIRSGLILAGREHAIEDPFADLDRHRQLQRDLYVPPGDRGFWQIGIRDPEDPLRPEVEQAWRNREPMTILLYYTDHLGGHPSISRFALFPQEDGSWASSVGRHWGIGPR